MSLRRACGIALLLSAAGRLLGGTIFKLGIGGAFIVWSAAVAFTAIIVGGMWLAIE